MSLDDHDKSDFAFKNLRGFAHTSPDKELYNESERFGLNVHKTHVWMSDIDPDPNNATGACIASYISADLLPDPTSNGHAFFAYYPAGHPKTGQRLDACIPPFYGDGYQAKLFAGATQIPVDDPRDWDFQYEDGILFQEDANASPTPTLIQVYVYTGTTLADGVIATGGGGQSGFSGRSGQNGFSGHSGRSGSSGASGQSGQSGQQGTSGFSGEGASGFSGEQGISGLSGFSGFSGRSGFSGLSGFSGASGVGYSGFSGMSGEANTTIGPAEDGDYTDGLFTDFVPTTPTGTAVDRFNEVLKALAPSPAPTLDSVGLTLSSPASGKMTFGATVPLATYTEVTGIGSLGAADIDVAFTVSGKRKGISASISGITGTIADDVSVSTQSPTPAYPANAFGNADQGTLNLEINGTLVRSLDLAANPGTVTDATTGFVISAATSVSFPNGTAFSTFKYRTGTWKSASSNFRKGWNYVRVYHTIGSTTYNSGYCDFVHDADTTTTTFASESLSSLTMTGSKYLSGVNFHTGGSATYGVTVQNAYRNTYSASASAVSYTRNPSSKIQSISSNSLPAASGNVAATYSPTKTASIVTSGIRFIDAGFTITATVLRTVQSTQTSSGATVSHLLLDNVSDSETSTSENFSAESWRITSNADFSLTTTDANWDSTQTIANGGSAGYNDGLQVINGTLKYPNVNYSTISNGPASNVDYSGCSGVRYFYRVFKPTSGTHANFVANFQGSGVTFIAVATSFTLATQMKVEMRAPSQTGWLDCYTDFATGVFTDGAGGRDSANGTGRALNTNWGLTIGTQNTANSGGRIFVRLTVPANFSGNLSGLTFTFN